MKRRLIIIAFPALLCLLPVSARAQQTVDNIVEQNTRSTRTIYDKAGHASSSSSSVLGDVDGDSTISVTDIALIVNHILGVSDDNFMTTNADMNGDGAIDINDVMATVSTVLGDHTPQTCLTCPDNKHPHMIDLGLPSGTKWACCNVDADKPEEYGGYFAWGETEEKEAYTLSNYQFVYEVGPNEGGGDPSSYDNFFRFLYLGDDIAGTSYDVAHVRWGGSWVMPSLAQAQELINHCSSKWTSMNGVNGRLFTGPSSGTIFIPAAGFHWYEHLHDAGDRSYYWSSTQSPTYPHNAYWLNFNSGYAGCNEGGYRGNGYQVRPVAE